MTKKTTELEAKIQIQEERIGKAQEELIKLVVELNEERISNITKTLRSLSKDKVVAILDYFVGEHLYDCDDEHLTYATNIEGNLCPRCCFMFLYKNKSNAAPFLLKDYIFKVFAEPIGQACEEDCDCEDCNGECEN